MNDARQRLQLMRQSGISQAITAMHHAERQADIQANEARRERRNNRYHSDIATLRTMMLLITGIEEIKVSGAWNNKDASYEENKKRVYALIETKPRAKHRNRYTALETAGKYLYAGIPGAIGAAAGGIANRTGLSSVNTAGQVVNRTRELADATLAAVTTVPIDIPASVVTGTTVTNASLVQQCMSWWMTPSAANAVATYTPVLSLLLHAGTAAAIAGNNRKIGSVLSLWERYQNACSCCDPLARIGSDWLGESSITAAQLHPVVAPILLAVDTYDKLKHYVRKKRAGTKGGVHRESYYMAQELWFAAQKYSPSHQVFEPRSLMIPLYGRCPVALLGLAILFGKGDAEAGAAKAVAAIMSEQGSAVNKIKTLIH
jgi:hypothetical protein